VLWVKRKPDRMTDCAFFPPGLRLAPQAFPQGLDPARQQPLCAGGLAGRHSPRTGIASGWQRMLFTDYPTSGPAGPHRGARRPAAERTGGRDPPRGSLITPSAASRSRFWPLRSLPRPWFALGIGAANVSSNGAREFFRSSAGTAAALRRQLFPVGRRIGKSDGNGHRARRRRRPARIPLMTRPAAGGDGAAGRCAALRRQRHRHAQPHAACGAHSMACSAIPSRRGSPAVLPHPSCLSDAGLSSEGVSQIHLPPCCRQLTNWSPLWA